MDKVFVGTIPSGERFFAVEREGRRMPLLNGRGDVAFWNPYNYGSQDDAEQAFSRVLAALDKPEGLKDVTPAPKGSRGR